MRPATFEDFAIGALAQHKTIAGARPLRDIGEQRYPYGVAIRLQDGSEYRWQITAESAPGDNYATPEQPAEGDPAPGTPAPAPNAGKGKGTAAGPFGLADADTLLAHILTHAGNRQIRELRRHGSGLTIRCHSKATIYLRALPVPAAARR